MKIIYLLASFLIVSISLISTSFADELVLKNGDIIKGKIEKINFNSNELLFRNFDGNNTTYSFESVFSYRSEITEAQSEKNEELSMSDIMDIDSLIKRSRYAVRITTNKVSYYITKDSANSDNSMKADLSGIDISGIQYLNNQWGVELGVYHGSTDRASSRYYQVPLSDLTSTNSITTNGGRGGLIYGWNIRDTGFRIYTGAGVYIERTTQYKTNSSELAENIYGATLKFGLGWGWSKAGLDFWGSFRSGQASGFEKGSSQGGLAFTYYF